MSHSETSASRRALLELMLAEEGLRRTGETIPTGTNGVSAAGYPLSFGQRRLWFLDQLEPGNPFYNFPFAVPFSVPINALVLERSVNEIVRRHEALRTVFELVDGEPVQRVQPELKIALEQVDLRPIAAEMRDAEVVRLATEMAQRPFDLTRGPLLRVGLVQRGAQDYVLMLTMHHIISDGWSLSVFWRELIALYNAFYMGAPSPLPELPIQYADFAIWQRERLQGEELARLLQYWKEQLAQLPVLQLPSDRPRAAVLSYKGAFQELVLSRSLVVALKALSQSEGVTLFMTLAAAFATLLQRYCNQDDIVIGTYVASRDRGELEGLIGFFVNTLVLRADLSGDPSFREALQRVREMALGAYAHQELPFERLVEELQPERDLGRNPLFQVTFQLFSAPEEGRAEARANGKDRTAATTIEVNRGMAIFDLAVNLWEGPEGLGGHIEYSTDLFDAATLERMAGHFRTLLKGIIANPDTKLSELPLLSEAERRQLLVEWNSTAMEYPELCVHELFAQQAARTPQAVALIADGQTVTYGQLNRRANALAHQLRQRGVKQEALVGVCAERGIEMVVGLLAVLKSGGAYVPLDPAYPKERLRFMLSDSGAAVLLTQQRYAQNLRAAHLEVVLLDSGQYTPAEREDAPDNHATPDSLCYVIYTSGSTGKPKGVMSPHRATVNRLAWMWNAYPFEKHERVCQKTALSFVDSVWELFGGLLQGIPTVIIADEAVRDPALLVEILGSHAVTRIVLVPSVLRMLIASQIDLAEKLPSLKYWTTSGEYLPIDLYRDFTDAVPHGVLINLYGSSEVAADVSYFDSNEGRVSSSVPIGRPIANTQLYVLDRHLHPVPIGVSGEIYVAGAGVARGYHQRPELTAERFIRNPFTPSFSQQLYRTGDLGRYRADGHLEFLGRTDHQVKIRGHRIELSEVETALLEHPKVREVIVVARAEVQAGTRLVAYVVPQNTGNGHSDSGEIEVSRQWQTVWNDTYEKSQKPDPTFNIAGWNSTYTGEAIRAAEMRDWVDYTVQRIRALRPRRVLEIGCGSGLLLLRLAPQCEKYVGTDFSSTALADLTNIIATREDLAHVRLLERDATRFDGFQGQFDLVILNSVVQYFPSRDYLLRVLTSAVDALVPGGTIFVGDVRSLPLLKAFHTSVEMRRGGPTLLPSALLQRIHLQVAHEEELVIDPLYFSALASQLTGLTRLTLELKRGRHINELTQFRYDVTLTFGAGAAAATNAKQLDWKEQDMTLAKLRSLLSQEAAERLVLSRVPNLRVFVEQKSYELLVDDAIASLDALREAVAHSCDGTVDPEDLWSLAEELSYDATIGWFGAASCDSYDVVLTRRGSTLPPPSYALETQSESAARLALYTNDPLMSIFAHRLVPGLRSHLSSRLPDYMVPSAFVVLHRLPQTPGGKVDRRALPAPEAVPEVSKHAYAPPRNTVEQTLAGIWAEVLNLDRVGIHDNFFELGGHSLLATQLISRIRTAFDIEIPVRAIFENPTLCGLASNSGLNRADQRRGSPQITRASMRRPNGPAADAQAPVSE
jgi:amino acid adenylation domain-containing protein